MSSPFDKLERILRLEREQGFHDRAVIGGLGRFMVFWQREAQGTGGAAGLIADEVVASLTGYGALAEGERRPIVEAILARLAAATVDGPAAKGQTPAQLAPVERVGETPAVAAPPVAAAPRAREASGSSSTDRGQDAQETSTLSAVPVVAVKGVSTVTQGLLARLGIETVRDLLYHFPRRHEDLSHTRPISQLQLGDKTTIVGAIRNVKSHSGRGGMPITRLTVSDGTGQIEASWFHQPHLAKRFRPGREIVLSGVVDEYLGRLVLRSPEWEPLQRELLHTGRLVPIYPLTEGIGARRMRSLVRAALDEWGPQIVDPLPQPLLASADLLDLPQALAEMHFPESLASLEQARRRLCFDEFLLLQLGVLHQRRLWQTQRSRALYVPREEVDAFVAGLPFELTGAQRRALDSILQDVQRAVPMNRLVQGDVGSGKTVVAVAAMLAVARNGLQVAVMAPTSILAEQHYATITKLLGNRDCGGIALLVGSLAADEKERMREALVCGKVRIVVGTHALIQDSVRFAKLGLVVVDEQHRFGVAQRQALRAKGREQAEGGPGEQPAVQPHVLALSATPIPRTLALTIYGDLDVSVLDEVPPSRQPVATVQRDDSSRERIYAFMRTQMLEGRQVFVICALVEEEDDSEVRGAVQEQGRLQAVFSDFRVGLLHGRMAADDKEAVMAGVAAGEIDLLVSTSVVEVGIDVPNATVMLIEGANRFGLAQLHQFRGRVGRGEHRSYCILMSDSDTAEANQRLQLVESESDGFALAEKDMELRGPGDFLGTRQHGLPPLRLAQLGDVVALDLAREAALKLMARDPELVEPEHRLLAQSLRQFWSLVDPS
jgi:ATP-dependent DNA helicase RecG